MLWVEKGEIIAPIKHDKSLKILYRFFGDQLAEVEDQLTVVPEVSTYENRSLGATTVSILVNSFELTL